MKKKNRLLISLLLIGLVLIITNSCMKDDANKDDSLTFGTLTDIDGNIYKTITIGNQTWMAENLKTTKYSDGTLIGTTSPASLDIFDENFPKYQWVYNGTESNVSTYGRMYTWYALTSSCNICPSDWHIPTDSEWESLIDYLGGYEVAGSKLKETGLTHWQSPNEEVTNETGFTALPGGYRFYYGGFFDLGKYGIWWTSTEASTIFARMHYMEASSGIVGWNIADKKIGYSVRCIRDY